ncbi:hypothetical protein J7J39_01450 [bacterium]|nr:hypothetical protein [bacterium]
MPKPTALEASGILLFLGFLSLLAAVVAFFQKAICGPWYCSFFFLILSLIFFFWGWETAK